MDTDSDEKNDLLNLNIDFSSQDLNVTSVQILLFFRVSLSVRSNIDMSIILYF